MISRTFKWDSDDEVGPGWRPAWLGERAGVAADFGMAHDMLEHRLKEDLGVENELRALGAMLYVRGQNGYFTPLVGGRPMEESLAFVIAEIAEQMVQGTTHFPADMKAPKPNRVGMYVDEQTVKQINDVARIGRAKAHATIASSHANEEWDRETRTEDHLKASILGDIAPGLMNEGYRIASQRYKKWGSYTVCEVFRKIMKAVQAADGNLNKPGWAQRNVPDYNPGDKLVISADLDSERVLWRVETEYDYKKFKTINEGVIQ